ncbi:MAG: hypothetical protein AAF808_00245 [Cyanobacteria bacterium P01_D01_bin.2]
MPLPAPWALPITSGNSGIEKATVFLMASFNPNLNREKVFTLGLIISCLTLGNSPSLAQLPELPPAPPAPPASPTPVPDTAPTPEEDSPNRSPVPSDFPQPNESGFIRPPTVCPENFDTLTDLLIRDIPSYTNRILQSSVADIPTAYRPAYVIAANHPERIPLEIEERVYTTNPSSGEPLYQLFFTTLERQYSGLDDTSINHFHWLFLAPSEQGWHMVFMFSAIEAEDEVQLPPRDSSQGSVGQAIQRWLIDCRAEAIAPE